MGEVNTRYVPAAVLLENPGITREEFIELLNKVHVGPTPKIDRDWGDLGPPERRSAYFHHGIFDLADILCIGGSVHWSGNPASLCEIIDEGNWPPGFSVLPNMDGDEWAAPAYRVITHIGDEIGEEECRELTFHRLKKGGIYEFERQGCFLAKWQVTKILERKRKKPTVARVMIRKVTPIFKEEVYETLEHLVAEHPEYDPDKLYDWSAETGKLQAGWRPVGNWVRKGKKYYLDDSVHMEEHDYTSIILTAEAIRHKAWRLLGYHAYWHIQRFLVQHPDSMQRHQQAIIGHWLNEYARTHNMTNNELLHMRAEFRAPKPVAFSDEEADMIILEEGMDPRGHGYLSEMTDKYNRATSVREKEEIPF